jgi:peptide/nickel transport system substrate-binding protein
VIAVATLSLVGGCASSAPSDDGTSITIGVHTSSVDEVFNPITTSVGHSLSGMAVYEALIYLDEQTNEYEPLLASEFVVSDDRRELTFTLRENIEFADGTPFDAEAAKACLELYLGEDGWAASYAAYGIEIDVVDDDTLQITTSERAIDYDFLVFPGQAPMVSPAALEDPAALAEQPAGTGPYLLEERSPGSSIEFVADPEYWDRDAVSYDRVKLVAIEDPVAGLNALKSGQIDAAAINGSLAAEAENSGLTIHTGFGRLATLAILDTAGATVPALSDVRVRRAINLALDREAIVETVDYGYARATSQAGTELFPWHVDGGDDRYEFDPEEATRLLAEAGYVDGFDLTIPVTPGYGSGPYEPAVQQALSEIGIRVTYDAFPDFGDWYSAVLAETYPVLLYLDFNVNLAKYMNEGNLYARMIDDEARGLLEIAKQGSVDDAADALRKLGEHVLDQAWLAPIDTPNTVWATIPEVEMLVGDVVPYQRLLDFKPAS